MLHATALRSARLAGTALLILSASADRAGAQDLSNVRVGDRIRFTSAAQPIRITGTLIERNADTLVVELSAESAPAAIQIASIWQLDVHRPRHDRILSYSLIGAGAGAVTVGGLFWLADGLAPCFGYCSPPTRGEVMNAAAFGALLVGVPTAVVTSYVVLARPWQRVRLPFVAGVNTAPDGRIALSASLPF